VSRLIVSFFSGWIAAQLFLCGLLAFDIGGLRTLIVGADAPWLPLAMLSLSLGALVGAASVGTAFSWADRSECDGGRLPALALAPVRRDR
jgi:hypothetical protein